MAEERAADAFDSEACADGDAEACDGPVTVRRRPRDPEEETQETLTEPERLEVEVEGGGPP